MASRSVSRPMVVHLVRLRRASFSAAYWPDAIYLPIEKCLQLWCLRVSISVLFPPWEAAQGTSAAPTCAVGERLEVGRHNLEEARRLK